MWVGGDGQRHASTALPLGERAGMPYTEGAENLGPTGIRSPDRRYTYHAIPAHGLQYLTAK